jgi:hypothetical protein
VVADGASYYGNGVNIGSKIINSDKSFEFTSTDVAGQVYTSFQNAVSQNGVLLGQSFDYNDTTGALNVYGSGFVISRVGQCGPASAHDDFYFAGDLNDTYALANGAGDVIFKDINGNVLNLIGVSASSLSAGRLGLS